MSRTTSSFTALGDDPYASIQAATRAHRARHGCGAYTLEDGPALRHLVAKYQPQRILEMATALGYTACCLAGGGSAHVDTIEADAEHVALAREQIDRVGLSELVTVHHGRFEDILPTLEPGYGLAFFDGFAPDPAVLRVVRQLLVDGAVLVCANLQLASTSVVRELMKDLDDPDLWQRQPSIGGGTTHVFVKVCASLVAGVGRKKCGGVRDRWLNLMSTLLLSAASALFFKRMALCRTPP